MKRVDGVKREDILPLVLFKMKYPNITSNIPYSVTYISQPYFIRKLVTFNSNYDLSIIVLLYID